MAQADGSLIRLLKRLARVDLLVIDDWGLTPLKPDQYRLFLEILDDRQGIGANLITSQYKVKEWHQLIGDPTVGDAILDRLVHSAHKLELEGDSMRGTLWQSHIIQGAENNRKLDAKRPLTHHITTSVAALRRVATLKPKQGSRPIFS